MLWAVAWLVGVVAGPESPANYPQLGGQPVSARAIGMGSAGRAMATELDAIVLNPALMSVERHYIFGGGFGWSQEQKAIRPTLGLIDSETTFVAAGINYAFERRDTLRQGVMDIHRAHFALSYAYGMFAIGVGVKYQRGQRYCMQPIPDQNVPTSDTDPTPKANKYYNPKCPNTPLDLDRTLPGVQSAPTGERPWVRDYESVTADVGINLQPIPQLSIGVVGYNLIPRCKTFPNDCDSREIAPMGLGLALAGNIADLSLAADVVLDFQTQTKTQPRIHLGAEYAILGVVPLRAGAIIDRVGGDNFWTAGLGFRHPVVGFDVGFHQGTSRPDNRTLVGSLRVTLQ